MKLLGSTKIKITKDKNDENLPHLEIPEVVLVHCNIVVYPSIVTVKCGHEYDKIFKEESIEILKILGLTNNTEEYQKIYNNV